MGFLTKSFNGAQVRMIQDGEAVYFLLRDVCDILKLGQVAGVVRRLDDEVISNHPIEDSLGRRVHAKFVNEDGLYDAILESRKPEAKAFRKWVTKEVLPSIRKHGAYMTPETIEKAMMNPDFIINLAGRLKDEQEKREAAEHTIEQQKPKVLFAETCLKSNNSILVRELAKLACDEGVKIGQNRLYNRLRQWGYIMKRSTEPTQRAMDLGYFEVIQRPFMTEDGTRTSTTTKVTPRGQIRIIDRLKKEQTGMIVNLAK